MSKTDLSWTVERTTDGGQTWQFVVISHRPEFSALAIVPSPNIEQDQTVYVLSNEALYRSIDGGITWEHGFDQFLTGRTYTNTMQVMALSPLLKDNSRRLFLGSAVGEFWTLNPAEIKWQTVLSASQWPVILTGEQINDIATAPNGDVWLGTYGKGIVRFAPDTTQNRYTVAEGLPDPKIDDLAITADNNLWASTYSGMVSFDGRIWTRHDFKNIVKKQTGFAVDPDGNIWLGGQGAARWNGYSWLRIDDPKKYTGSEVFDFVIGPDNTFWFATSSGAAWYKDGVWSNLSLPGQYRVAVGPDGAAYFMNGEINIQRYFNGKWSQLPHPKPGFFISAISIRGFYVAADGAVWRGTDEGVFRFDGQTWRQFTAQDGLPSNKVSAIAEDAKGQLWFGTDNGAAYVNPATLGLSPVVW